MNGSNRRTFFIAAGALGVLVIGLASAVIARQVAVSQMSRDIVEQKRTLAELKKELCNCANWKKDYGSLCLKLGGRMPECSWSDQMPFVVAQLTGIVESHHLKIESLQPQPMTAVKPVLRFPLRIGLTADLKTLADVLEDIEKTVPLLEIERLDIRKSQSREGKLQADMTISSFVVIDKNAPMKKRRDLPKPPESVKKAETLQAKAPASETPVQKPAIQPAVQQQALQQEVKQQREKDGDDDRRNRRNNRQNRRRDGRPPRDQEPTMTPAPAPAQVPAPSPSPAPTPAPQPVVPETGVKAVPDGGGR